MVGHAATDLAASNSTSPSSWNPAQLRSHLAGWSAGESQEFFIRLNGFPNDIYTRLTLRPLPVAGLSVQTSEAEGGRRARNAGPQAATFHMPVALVRDLNMEI